MIQWILVLFCTLSAQAIDQTGRVSVGGSLGMVMEAPWASSEFRNAVAFGPRASLFARWNHATYTGIELGLDYFNHRDSSLAVRAARLSYLFRFLPEQAIRPVFALGFGYAKAQSFFQAGDRDVAMIHLRAGVEKELSENLELAFHLDHFSLFKTQPNGISLHDLSPALSVIYHFGRPSPLLAQAATQGASPAAMDSDGDSVLDREDRCPNTRAGTRVNAMGCAEQQSFEIRLDVKFRAGTAAIAGNAEAELEELAGILKAFPNLKVELQGHTDTRGSTERNRALSEARAQAVKIRLVQAHGIEASRLTAKGYGSEAPLARPEKTEADRALNRRVAAKVLQ